ncbi:MAG TPA: ABC transporter substrate-binding protein [Crocinitomix sp.]|nr:ABC transporter substrate-binding protein [Crocinitomix sp.]
MKNIILRMKKALILVSVFSLFFSCTEGNNENVGKNNKPTKSGGEITIPLDSYFTNQKPTEIIKTEAAQIYGQILESLVKFNDKTLNIEPSLAEKWTVSDDGLIYTFYLRRGVVFHDNKCFENGKGREVTTQDVKDMFYRVYENTPKNSSYSIFKNTIKGGDEYYNKEVDEIEGVQIDDETITITLTQPNNTFLAKLVNIYTSIIPEESLVSKEKWNIVGTGPFTYNEKSSTSELVVLDKNKNYWMSDSTGVKLPYLDRLTYKFYDDDNARMEDFWNGNIAIVKNVPITKISEVLEERIVDFKGKKAKYILESVPQMSTTYLVFNMKSKALKDPKVRQAINYAINRKKIVEKTLRNQAYEIGKFGITPPLPKIYKDYDFEGIEDYGYTLNSEKAKQLLAEAGYPDGKGFPTLSVQFKKDNSRYLVMSEIQTQLKSVLNINIDIEQVEFNQLIENEAYGKADIFHTIWVGDFPSPESFLLNFYGKLVPSSINEPSHVNVGRYINKEFDELFEKGMRTLNQTEANDYFAETEKIMLQDPPLAVLYYGENLWLKQANLKNFNTNGMNYIDFTKVYVKKNNYSKEK